MLNVWQHDSTSLLVSSLGQCNSLWHALITGLRPLVSWTVPIAKIWRPYWDCILKMGTDQCQIGPTLSLLRTSTHITPEKIALTIAPLTWSPNFSFWWMVMPRYLTVSTRLTRVLLMKYWALTWCLLFEIQITLHFLRFREVAIFVTNYRPCQNHSASSLHLSLWRLPTRGCNHQQRFSPILLTYTRTRNNNGPNMDPWGTPDVTFTQSENSPSTATLCDLLDRKPCRTGPLTPMCSSVIRSLSCGTESKTS